MKLATSAVGGSWPARVTLVAVLGAMFIPARAPAADEGASAPEPKPAAPLTHPKPDPRAMEVRCADGSTLRLIVRDEQLELSTPHGTLLIPVADVRRVEFGLRIPAEVSRRIDTAIANLGSPAFQLREEASAELLALGDQAYPALLRASRQTDQEVVRRVEDVLVKLRETIPERQLAVPDHDIVYMDESKVAGRIAAAALKVHTTQFGDQVLKLADVRSMRSLASIASAPTNVQPDPGNLTGMQGQIGKTAYFKVTGTATGAIWGTDIYTADSNLALAAVHAGILRPGQNGVVKVTIVNPPASFDASTRNGVTSYPYGPYPGAYQVGR